jgi:predicted enzyme related to lactoylglutathione lyase
MTRISEYAPGQFSWVDILTPDAGASRDFYTALFDWTTVDNPTDQEGVYTQFQFQGEMVAGIGEMGPVLKKSGMPAVWSSYVSVDDLDQATSSAAELGARIEMPPMRVMEAGRMSIVADPGGARLSLWQPGEHIGAGQVNHPNSLCWNELATRDIDAAIRFYSELFGWQIERSASAPNPYYEITNQGRMNGGMLEMTEEWGDAPPHWMAYISVFDCDETLERVRRIGGQVNTEPVDIPPGRFAVIQDPQGGILTVMKLNEPE